jgi:hypothetical protein
MITFANLRAFAVNLGCYDRPGIAKYGDVMMRREYDWSRLDAMTAVTKQTPRLKIIRRALGLTQE